MGCGWLTDYKQEFKWVAFAKRLKTAAQARTDSKRAMVMRAEYMWGDAEYMWVMWGDVG